MDKIAKFSQQQRQELFSETASRRSMTIMPLLLNDLMKINSLLFVLILMLTGCEKKLKLKKNYF